MEKTLFKIGVTGSAGSGKSLVCGHFRQLGLVTLDCDRIAREIVEPGMPAFEEVVGLFGPGVVGPDGTLDRSGLRKIIIDVPGLRKQLEAVLHPRIISEMVRRMETAEYLREPACAVEVPLLFELKMEQHFDVTVVVAAEDKALVERISNRDGVDLEAARKMLALQMPQAEKIQRADHVIHNRGRLNDLADGVQTLWAALRKQRLTKRS